MINNHYSKRLKSYVNRSSKMTAGQKSAYLNLKNQFLVDENLLFDHLSSCFVEIGFGKGHSLLALAKNNPNSLYIGIETHKASVGSLLMGAKNANLQNLKIYENDAFLFIEKLPLQSIDGLQIFFPDPWPKRKHHGRRLIQLDFIQSITNILKPNAYFHLATDWEDYALHMIKIIAAEKRLKNISNSDFSERSLYRPCLTAFENKALREKRKIWELQFIKLSCTIDEH